MSPPTVAVIIPTHNRWPTVARAVASVLAQSYPATECIVVDDGSTDGTSRSVPQQFGDQVQLLALPRNIEKSAARNAGIRAARADYVCMLDSDDELTKHSVEDRLAVFQRDPSFKGVAYGLTCPPDGGPDTRWANSSAPEGDVLLPYVRRPFLHNNGFLLSRQNMEQHGMYDVRLTNREDKELLIRLAARLEFRFCGAFVNRMHFSAGSARMNYHKAAAQGLLMLECLRSDPLVQARLGTAFREVERTEHWEHLRDLYKAGKFGEFRAACGDSWKLFAGCGQMQRQLLRRWIGSCFLQLFASGRLDRIPSRPCSGAAAEGR